MTILTDKYWRKKYILKLCCIFVLVHEIFDLLMREQCMLQRKARGQLHNDVYNNAFV